MSKDAEWRNKGDVSAVKKTMVLILCITVMAVAILWFVRPAKIVEVVKIPDVQFSLMIEKEKILSEIKAEGIEKELLHLLTGKLPDEISVSCVAEYTGDKNSPFRIKHILFNGEEIPDGILNDIGQKYLDFDCSLVYN